MTRFDSILKPNLFVNIEPFIDSKVELMAEYKTEYSQMPDHRGDWGIKAWAAYNGLMSGLKYAEGLQIQRSVWQSE